LTIDEEDEEEESAEGEKVEEGEEAKPKTGRRLDLEVEASGFGSAMQTELEDVSPFSSLVGYGAKCAVHERGSGYASERR